MDTRSFGSAPGEVRRREEGGSSAGEDESKATSFPTSLHSSGLLSGMSTIRDGTDWFLMGRLFSLFGRRLLTLILA